MDLIPYIMSLFLPEKCLAPHDKFIREQLYYLHRVRQRSARGGGRPVPGVESLDGRRVAAGPGAAALGVRPALSQPAGRPRRDPVREGAWGRRPAAPALRRGPSDDGPL